MLGSRVYARNGQLRLFAAHRFDDLTTFASSPAPRVSLALNPVASRSVRRRQQLPLQRLQHGCRHRISRLDGHPHRWIQPDRQTRAFHRAVEREDRS